MTEAEAAGRRGTLPGRRVVFALCVLVAIAFAVYPVLRCFAPAEVLYNEGWNVYNAQQWAAGDVLYPTQLGWRLINYPALSFAVGAWLHRLTGAWLLPMRLLCLVCTLTCAACVALVLRAVGAGRWAAWLGGAFALALFCVSATAYVGVDDPQMFAEAVFALAFLLYVRREQAVPSAWRVAGVAVLFVVAGCIKQSPLEFPLAVLLDLLLLSLPMTGLFVLVAAAAGAVAVLWNVHVGGPGFVAAMLLPRGFSLAKSLVMGKDLLGPLLVPLCLAVWQAVRLRNDARRRVLALLLASGLAVGFFFEGGAGVFINVWFGALLAMAMLLGWMLQVLRGAQRPWLQTAAAGVLFAWMVIPAMTEDVWNPVRLLHQQRQANAEHAQMLALLRSTPGPALCESLLLCEQAGKPYLYDPFNATRAMNSGRVPVAPLVQQVRQRQFRAVQLHAALPGDAMTRERFPDAVVQAIQQNYHEALRNESGVVLLPNTP